MHVCIGRGLHSGGWMVGWLVAKGLQPGMGVADWYVKMAHTLNRIIIADSPQLAIGSAHCKAGVHRSNPSKHPLIYIPT